MADGGVETVHEDAGALQGVIVRLAHVGAVGTDEVEVLTGAEPVALDDRVRAHGGAGDDVGLRDGPFQIIGHGHTGPVGGQRLGPGAGAVPDGECRIREARTVSLPQGTAHGACADDEDLAAVLAGQTEGGAEAVACGFPLGHKVEIDDRFKHPIAVGIERDAAVDGGFALRGIARKDRG